MANVSILAIGMVASLVFALGSFRLAGLIGIVAVLSVGLGLGSLWLFGFPFGFMAIIGTMGLIGIAINDSIVVVSALAATHSFWREISRQRSTQSSNVRATCWRQRPRPSSAFCHSC